MLDIFVLHYNQNRLTDRCLASLQAQNFIGIGPHKITVLDNGSFIPYKNESIHIKRFIKNRGNIGGQNACFEEASADWVLFVSNDVECFQSCVQELWNHRFDGQLMPVILNTDHTVQSVGGYLAWPGYGINITNSESWMTKRIAYIPSIIYLMPKQRWKQVGGFDEILPMAYEDVDMGLRLGRNRIRVCQTAKAVHLGNATLQFSGNERFREARRMVIAKHYGGINQFLRLLFT